MRKMLITLLLASTLLACEAAQGGPVTESYLAAEKGAREMTYGQLSDSMESSPAETEWGYSYIWEEGPYLYLATFRERTWEEHPSILLRIVHSPCEYARLAVSELGPPQVSIGGTLGWRKQDYWWVFICYDTGQVGTGVMTDLQFNIMTGRVKRSGALEER